jgi:hypothetical protein
MLITKKIKIKINGKEINYFKRKGLNVKCNDEIEIDISLLSLHSHRKVIVKCDICEEEKYITYKNYNNYIKKSLDNKYTCNKCNTEKRQNTCIKKYGVDNVANSNIIKEKTIKTCIKKYGVEYYFQSKQFKSDNRENFIKMGFNVRSTSIEDWLRYQRFCMAESYKNYKKLKDEWNGYDYYDGTYIKNNYELQPNDLNYPTVDHKISIVYGFINNISPEYIFSINNLCITKRSINSMKRHLTENEFRTKFNFLNEKDGE